MASTSLADRTSSPPLIGRERELTELRAGLERGLSGAGQILLLAGEPGIGKTRTAEELASEAAARGALVLWGRCHEAEWTPPYWPWVQALRAYVRGRDADGLRADLGIGAPDVAQLVPEVRDRLPGLPEPPVVDPEQARFRLFDSVVSFLTRAANGHPLVVILDDLHWADTPSLLLLEFLARDLRDAPLVVVGTYRDVERGRHHTLSQTLGELTRVGSRRILLRGLSEAEVGRIVATTADVAPSAALVTAVFRETEGNPFFVTEIIRFLAADGRLTDPDTGDAGAIVIPQSVREVIGRRLNRLSPACNDVLATAAAIGRDFSLPLLTRVRHAATDELLEVLEEAVAARVIEEAPRAAGRYRFAHALIRETLYEELSTVQRVRLHRRIGQALELLYGASPEPHLAELARHFVQAAPGGDVERAIDYARRAGERAMALLAYEDAAAHDEIALQLLDLLETPDETLRCELLLALGEARRSAGDPAFRVIFEQAADRAKTLRDPERQARAALGAAGQETALFRADLSLVRLLEEALTALGPRDAAIRLRVLARLALELALETDSLQRADGLSDEAVALARRHGDLELLARALHARYTVLCGYPDALDEALVVATEMTHVADRTTNQELALIAHCWRTFVPMMFGDMKTVNAELATGARLAEELRQPYQTGLLRGIQGWQALIAGRFAEGERLEHEYRLIMERLRGRSENLWAYVQAMFFLRREQGRLTEFKPLLTSIIAQHPDYPIWRAIRAQYCVEMGFRDEAHAELDRFAAADFAALQGHGVWMDYWLDAGSRFAEVCAALGTTDHAPVLYEMLLPFASLNALGGGMPTWCGSVSHFLGLLATTLGRWKDADRHFEDALTMNARIDAPPFVARTQVAYATMLLTRDEPEDLERALALATAARATAEEIGMVRLAEQLTPVMERLAIGRVDRPAAGAALVGLTERERHVLRLLVAGRSNPEIAEALFISRATARTHVGNILAKLGVNSRAEAVAAAHRFGLLGPSDASST